MLVHSITAVVWKELRDISRGSVLAGLAFAVFWSILGALTLPAQTSAPGRTASGFVGYIPMVLMLYSGSSLVIPAFYGEKFRRTIEPLLCTPLSIRDLWLGKVLAVSLIAYFVLVITAGVYLTGAVIWFGMAGLPNAPALVQLLIVSPLLALAIFGLMGYVFLVLLNPALVRYINIIILMGALFGFFKTVQWLSVNWLTVTGMLIGALLLSALTFRLASRLDKERIVLTIP